MKALRAPAEAAAGAFPQAPDRVSPPFAFTRGLPFGLLLGCSVLAHAEDLPSAPAPRPEVQQQHAAGLAVETARISGVAVDSGGARIAGATIRCTGSGGQHRTATSGADGRFVLEGVAPGSFALQLTAPGFQQTQLQSSALPGQWLELGDVTLAVSTVAVTVDAVTPEQEAQAEVHAEVQQRLAGVLPNFFVSYRWDAQPLSTRQKYYLAWRNAGDPGNLALVGTLAGVQQAADAFPGYHQGWKGYGRRYGADLANLWVGTFMGGAVLPSLFRQDPRYFYKGTGTHRQRFLYALSTAVICRGDNGRRQPAFASVLGDFSAGAISNLYYAPSDRQGARLTLINGFLAVAGDAMNNVIQEFFLHRITTGANKSVDVPAASGR